MVSRRHSSNSNTKKYGCRDVTFAAAFAISSKILKGEAGIVEKYKQFLSGGSSMDPIDLLKLCDVDMSAAQPIEEALDVFEKYLNELEKEYKTCKDDND